MAMNLYLSEVCQEIKNWFVRKDSDKHHGTFEIRDGAIVAPFLVSGQYFRIIGSTFNDGVYQYPETHLHDETFEGSVWAMAVPAAFLTLVGQIEAWATKYENVDSPAMSPFTSENYFGDYSYSKNAPGSSAGSGSSAAGWKSIFADQLTRWRKIL